MKRFFSILLALVLTVGLVPAVSVYADSVPVLPDVTKVFPYTSDAAEHTEHLYFKYKNSDGTVRYCVIFYKPKEGYDKLRYVYDFNSGSNPGKSYQSSWSVLLENSSGDRTGSSFLECYYNPDVGSWKDRSDGSSGYHLWSVYINFTDRERTQIMPGYGFEDTQVMVNSLTYVSSSLPMLDWADPKDPVIDVVDYNANALVTLPRGYALEFSFKADLEPGAVAYVGATRPFRQSEMSPDDDPENNQSYSYVSGSGVSVNSLDLTPIPWRNFTAGLIFQKHYVDADFKISKNSQQNTITLYNPTFWKDTVGNYPGWENPYNDAIQVSYNPAALSVTKYRLIEVDGVVVGKEQVGMSDDQGADITGTKPPNWDTGGDSTGGNGASGPEEEPTLIDIIKSIPDMLKAVGGAIADLISSAINGFTTIISQGSNLAGYMRDLYGWLPTDISVLIYGAFSIMLVIAVFRLFF